MRNRKNFTRREAVAAAAGLFGAASLPAASRYKPLVSAQLYVWTQNFHTRKLSVAAGVEEALAATRRAGYRRVELTSDFFDGEAREKTFAALRKNGLEMPVVYGGAVLHEEAAAEKSIDELLKLAATVRPAGTRMIVTNPNPKPNRGQKTDAELTVQARAVNRLGAELSKREMRLLLHHHDPEMADGAREWRHLLKNTDPAFAALCMDLHWVYRGGQSAMALLQEAGERVASIHLRNSKAGVWTEDFGDGDVDYLEVARYLRDTNYAGYLVVELAYEKGTALSRSLEENLRLSRIYTEKTFGVKA